MILMLAITATLIGALGFAKFRQIQEGMAQAAAFQPPPEAVTTIVAKQSKWPDTLSAIGTIAAVQGVTVSADLPGIVGESTLSPEHPCSPETYLFNWIRNRNRHSWRLSNQTANLRV